ncbi:MAG: flagellar hook-length control protein FliK, partial [Pseudomonadota bacterium]|nr:flagellar hook-length control protein FliK [Pseudomonadota bacterium]
VQATGQATGQTSGQAGGPALPAEAATAPRSSGDAAGEPAPKAATRQTGQASQAMQTPGTGNKGTAPASGATTGSSASATGATGSAAADQTGPSQNKADARMSAEPSRTPAVITTAGTGETGTTTAQSGVSLPDAASPAGQTAASQAGQAAASQAPQVRNAQVSNGRTGNDAAPVAGKPASVGKSGNQGAKPAPASSSATATNPSTVAPGADIAADATGKTAGPGSTDTAAPLRQGRETRAILETGNSGGLAGSGRKTASAQAQGDPSAGSSKSGTIAPAVPNTTEVRPDAAIQLPRDAAPGNPSPLGQLLATNGGAGDVSQPLQTVETDTAQADAEIQLNRAADARAGVDRAGSNLPRFAPHTAQQLAGQITRNFNNGQRVFDIRLDPAELGKVDVRLELRADNRVHAVLTAERPETLAELQRAARDLERSLNEAGLELAEDGLSFQMSEDGQTPGSDDDTTGTAMPIFADGGESGLTADTAAPVVQQSRYGFLLTRREGVDMRV